MAVRVRGIVMLKQNIAIIPHTGISKENTKVKREINNDPADVLIYPNLSAIIPPMAFPPAMAITFISDHIGTDFHGKSADIPIKERITIVSRKQQAATHVMTLGMEYGKIVCGSFVAALSVKNSSTMHDRSIKHGRNTYGEFPEKLYANHTPTAPLLTNIPAMPAFGMDIFSISLPAPIWKAPFPNDASIHDAHGETADIGYASMDIAHPEKASTLFLFKPSAIMPMGN